MVMRPLLASEKTVAQAAAQRRWRGWCLASQSVELAGRGRDGSLSRLPSEEELAIFRPLTVLSYSTWAYPARQVSPCAPTQVDEEVPPRR